MVRCQWAVEMMMMMMMMMIVTMMMELGHSKKPSARCGCSTKVYYKNSVYGTVVASLTLLGSLAFLALGTCVLQDDLCLVQL